MDAIIRRATPADAEICGNLLYEAFEKVADRYGYPSIYPSRELPAGYSKFAIAHPLSFSAIAEKDGEIIGVAFMDERNPIRAIGPVAVRTDCQSAGAGRKLMEALLARGRDAVGIRLCQESYNLAALSLYTKLGFEVKEAFILTNGRLQSQPDPTVEVRPLRESDLEECAQLCQFVYGFDRLGEMRDTIGSEFFYPFVAIRQNRIVAYVTAANFLGHGVAATEEDMKALLLGMQTFRDEPFSFIVSLHKASFWRWCLSEGLKAVKPLTLMALGQYREPQGLYLPSAAW